MIGRILGTWGSSSLIVIRQRNACQVRCHVKDFDGRATVLGTHSQSRTWNVVRAVLLTGSLEADRFTGGSISLFIVDVTLDVKKIEILIAQLSLGMEVGVGRE